MIRWLPAFFGTSLLLSSCSEKSTKIRLDPNPDGRSILEVGYWRGDGSGIGGHIWIALAPFQLGSQQVPASELDLNRFKIHLPYDLNELNDKKIDCASNEFSFGPHGSLTIRPDEGDRIPLTPTSIQFKRIGNQSFEMKMTGVFESGELPQPFSISAPLNLQFGYGAREPHPNEATIDKAIQIAGKEGLPRWCNETYESTYHFEGWTQTFILLRPHRNEDFQKWTDELSPLSDLSSLALPQFETPAWWLTEAHVTMSEPEDPLVIYNEKNMKEDDEGNKTVLGIMVEVPATPEAPSDIVKGDLHQLIKDQGELDFRRIAASKNASGWVALRPDSKYSGSIFIFHFARNPS